MKTVDFSEISYLMSGNGTQQRAYRELVRLGIFSRLQKYTPVITGTIPIGIDTCESDLDIVCHWNDKEAFKADVVFFYSGEKQFQITEKKINDCETVVARFHAESFVIEIFGQNRPVEMQEAYRHMLIEYKILRKKGEAFRQKIIELKKQGIKTEPAFARLLGLKGNPYDALLKYTKIG